MADDRNELGQFIAGNTVGGGYPTRYDKDVHPQLAYKICLLGATGPQLAFVMGFSERTIYNWQEKHPEFDEAVHRGKAIADLEVQSSLRGRALGVTTTDVTTVVKDGDDKSTITTTAVRQHPPDTTACIFWSKNRDQQNWRDKQEIDHTGNLTVTQMLDAIDGKTTGLPVKDDPYLNDETDDTDES